MSFKNKTSQKIISALLIILIIAPVAMFSVPQKAEAFWFSTWLTDASTTTTAVTTGTGATAEVTQVGLKIKDVAKEILRQILMTVARRFLQQMTKSTINWINSGFHGAPLFVENPKSFFRDIAKYEIKNLIDSVGRDPKRFPFGRNMALGTIAGFKRTLENNMEYSLSRVIDDPILLERYRSDFDVGGWNGFLINTQYPQNNYLGYQMLYTEELARRLEGTIQNKAQKVNEVLDRGMGFLSPETCADNNGNNAYNTVLANQFQRPTYKSPTFALPPAVYESTSEVGDTTTASDTLYRGAETQESIKAREAYAKDWQTRDANLKKVWARKNTCENLVATTPGSVVANQIMGALDSGRKLGELGAALGNSISAIFDALLNKFLGDGLNALASKANPVVQTDNWEYDKETLGGPADGTNVPWDSGPDEEIVLDKFVKQLDGKTTITDKDGVFVDENIGNSSEKTIIITDIIVDKETNKESGIETKYEFGILNETLDPSKPELDVNTGKVTITKDGIKNEGTYTFFPGDIENTKKELKLISNEISEDPGVTEVMGEIWPKARDLDICQPGPDLGWKERVMNELSRNSKKLQEKLTDDDGKKSAQADLALKELKFAVNFFKDWIINNMMKGLPRSMLYMDAIDEIGELAQQADELTDKRRTKSQALARLQAIKLNLDTITRFNSNGKVLQPEKESVDEKIMITLRKQYNANKIGISNSNTVDDMKNELAIAKEKLVNLNKLVAECEVAREANGWSLPGGPLSAYSGTSSSGQALSDTEKGIFCDAPIKGGYTHESFIQRNTETHSEIPLVNAEDVLKWRRFGFIFGNFTVDIELSCSVIWKANVLDYKGNLPGTTKLKEPYVELLDDISGLGICNGYNNTTGETVTESNVTQSDCGTAGGSWTPF
ncbi:MAG: hypothetical protein AAB786_01450 [Patescibacteria group bacterium]